MWFRFSFAAYFLFSVNNVVAQADACPQGQVVPNSFIVSAPLQASGSLLEKANSHKIQKLGNSKKSSIYKININSPEDKASLLSLATSLKANIISDCFIPLDVQTSSSFNDGIGWVLRTSGFSHQSEAFSFKNTVIVAVSDTGVDIDHEGLSKNLWINETEANGLRGIDDDGNGYVDDIYGYDFADNDNNPRPGNRQGSEHGTHVAGLIGSDLDLATGFRGFAFGAKLMSLKVFSDQNSSAQLSDLLASVYYAADNGADIINCSWGARKLLSSVEKEAFDYAISKGSLVVAAAGNASEDVRLYSPANYSPIFTVGSINSKSTLSRFSNFGSAIDMVAPGGDSANLGGLDEAVFSLLPKAKGGFGQLRGTSMAAPIVSAALAMLKSYHPKVSSSEAHSYLQLHSDIHTDEYGYIYNQLNFDRLSAALMKGSELAESNNPQQGQLRELASIEGQLSFAANGGCAYNRLTANEPTRASVFGSWILLFVPLSIRAWLRKST